MTRIDHLILGCPDLAAGLELFHERTGVRPALGGEHPNLGTHNALVSLGRHSYLEIIAPRPRAEVQGRWRILLAGASLSPIGWAVRTDDLAHSLAAVERGGFQATVPAPGSRLQPGGQVLRWATADILGLAVPLAPFLIEWTDADRHPSMTAPPGCSLEALALGDPEPALLARLMRTLELDVAIDPSDIPRMSIALVCPRGPVSFNAYF